MGVIIIGGGPRPGAKIYVLMDPSNSETSVGAADRFVIMDGNELVMICQKLSHAKALLPLIQSGE